MHDLAIIVVDNIKTFFRILTLGKKMEKSILSFQNIGCVLPVLDIFHLSVKLHVVDRVVLNLVGGFSMLSNLHIWLHVGVGVLLWRGRVIVGARRS